MHGNRKRLNPVQRSHSFVTSNAVDMNHNTSVGIGTIGLPPLKFSGSNSTLHVQHHASNLSDQSQCAHHFPQLPNSRNSSGHASNHGIQVEQLFEPISNKMSYNSIPSNLPLSSNQQKQPQHRQPVQQQTLQGVKMPDTISRPNSEESGESAGNVRRPSGSRVRDRGLTPEQVLKLYHGKLTEFEHQEIFNYPQIYFVGQNAKKRSGMIGGQQNCGYDDENGSYVDVSHDHIGYRYEILKLLGKGSFGQVLKCYDHRTQTHVALKMVRNEKRFHRQAQEEIRILDHLRKHDKDNNHNLVHMVESFQFRNHVCMTFELLSINLYELIKKNKFQGFSLGLVRKFAHSVLQCLDLLFRHRIIHCDMKPENVLLKQPGRSGIKVSS